MRPKIAPSKTLNTHPKSDFLLEIWRSKISFPLLNRNFPNKINDKKKMHPHLWKAVQ